MKIAVVATGGNIIPAVAETISSFVAQNYPSQLEVTFHPQCFLSHGHFAGTDRERLNAFRETANDPSFDGIWFARGGHGTCRIAEQAALSLNANAAKKIYIGYSDCGYLLASLYVNKIGQVFHGPMPCDISKDNGISAVRRALDFFLTRNPHLCEKSINNTPSVAFNMTVLSQMVSTPVQPSLSGHVVMLEETGEYMYRIDRTFGHIAMSGILKNTAGVRLGRCNPIPENDPDFQQTEDDVARFWCSRENVPYLGRADIGHDVDNKIVPFGTLRHTG